MPTQPSVPAVPSRSRRRRAPRDPLQVNLRWVVFLILFLVIIPTTLMTGIGIVVLTKYRETPSLLMGMMVTSFSASVVAGAVLLLALARRGARLAKMQETFLSRMSHELLTPLSGIRLHAQILEELQLPPNVRDSVHSIHRESERLEELVERIMSWRKVRSGRHVYQFEPARLGSVIDRVRERVPGADAVRFRVLDPDLVMNIDANALAEAIANLLQNAIKYAGADGPIELSARRLNRIVVINVADSGPGLPPGLKPSQLFEPFVRFVPEQRADPGGSGLGLSISRQIVRAHGGKLSFGARRHGGVNFFIILPAGGNS